MTATLTINITPVTELAVRIAGIALTAFARSEDRLRALECGFRDHVSKPVEPAELVRAVALAAQTR
eukprot:gene46551-58041_t